MTEPVRWGILSTAQINRALIPRLPGRLSRSSSPSPSREQARADANARRRFRPGTSASTPRSRADRRQRLEVVGTEGWLEIAWLWNVRGPGIVLRCGADREHVAIADADAYRLQVDNLSRAVRGLNRSAEASAEPVQIG